MQVFELHFNSKKEGALFDTFCYEPQKPYEKKLGSLYMAGELSNLLPQNSQLLNRLAETINQEYYFKSQRDPEESFKESLNKANEFFSKEVQNENVSWMGNLNLAVLNIHSLILSFAKTGDIKIYLRRADDFIDVGTNLEFQDIEPYPLKVFSNIAQGKLSIGDKIIITTNKLFDFLNEEGLLENAAQIADKNSLKRFLKEQKEKLSVASGVCLLMLVDQEELSPTHSFSFKEAKRKLNITLPKLTFPKFTLPKISFLPKLTLPGTSRYLAMPKINLPTLPLVGIKRKGVLLLIALILILILGFFAFGSEKEKEKQKAENVLQAAQLKMSQAEGFLIIKEKEKAESLLKEALLILEPISTKDTAIEKKVNRIRTSIQENLDRLK